MPDQVVSNTSPLFYLHRLGHLELMQKLYGEIVIPEAVSEELRVGREAGHDAPDPAAFLWIAVQSVRVPELVALITDLGPGEAEALALALEYPGSLLVVDDAMAREFARLKGMRFTGTAGVLLRAKEQGHLKTVGPLLDGLASLGFHLHAAVKSAILKLAGE